MVPLVNQFLGVMTLIGDVIIVLLIVSFPYRKDKNTKKLYEFVGKNALLFSWIVALFATFGSLFYSDVAHYDPCKLCWFQRIFMYPLAIILGIAYFAKDNTIKKYALVMSFIGGAIALYHYLLQLNIAPSLPCSAVGYSVSCSQRFVLQFGYITIPLMALTAFLLIVAFLSIKKR